MNTQPWMPLVRTRDPFCLLVLVQAVDHNSYEGSHTDCISLDDGWY